MCQLIFDSMAHGNTNVGSNFLNSNSDKSPYSSARELRTGSCARRTVGRNLFDLKPRTDHLANQPQRLFDLGPIDIEMGDHPQATRVHRPAEHFARRQLLQELT